MSAKVKCRHNYMIRTDNEQHPWKCAACSYVYGKGYESKKQKGLFYWAELDSVFRGMWVVSAQAEGGRKTQGYKDEFTNQDDADDIAQLLAKGEL